MSGKVRAIDENNDWTFGKGLNCYKSGNDAIAQNIKTRLQEWKGNCFFNNNAGIDWLNRLEKNQVEFLKQDTKNIILQTDGVVALNQISFSFVNRNFSISYQVQTIYSQISDQTIIKFSQ